jgi:phage shock protein B
MGYFMFPLSAFFIFVAPLWLVLHYRSRKQINKSFSSENQKQLETLLSRTELLQKRIYSLEEILDNEAPQWRKK